ncbi:MAG: hypothetical protein WA888_08550 [Burkholderiaceae bacterium]
MISSRTLLLFLIALNLLALAWWSGAMQPLLGSVREPGRVESQIEPDSLVVVQVLASAKDQPGQGMVSPAGGQSRDTSQISGGFVPQPVPSAEPLAKSDITIAERTLSTTNAAATMPDTQSGLTDKTTPIDTAAAAPPPITNPRPDAADIVGQSLAVSASAHDSEFTRNTQWFGNSSANPALVTDKVLTPAATADDMIENAQWQNKTPVGVEGLPLVAAALSGSGSVNEDRSTTIDEEPLACQRFTGLSYKVALEVEEDLAPYGVLTELKRVDKGDFLVYIEPLPSFQLAKRKEEQLRGLGVQDVHVIRAGYYRNGISLGMLRNDELATQHKSQMASLGVTTMRIGPVNVLSARYDLTVKSNPVTMDSKVRGHNVLGAIQSSPCRS